MKKKYVIVTMLVISMAILTSCNTNKNSKDTINKKTVEKTEDLLKFEKAKEGIDSITNIYSNTRDGIHMSIKNVKIDADVNIGDISSVNAGIMTLPLIEETSKQLPEAYDMFFKSGEFFKDEGKSYDSLLTNRYKRRVNDSLSTPNEEQFFTFGGGVNFYNDNKSPYYSYPFGEKLISKNFIKENAGENAELNKNYDVGDKKMNAKEALEITKDFNNKLKKFDSKIPLKIIPDYVSVFQNEETKKFFFYVKSKTMYKGVPLETGMTDQYYSLNNKSTIMGDHVVISNYNDAVVCNGKVVFAGVRTGFKTIEEKETYKEIITPEAAFKSIAEKLAETAEFKFDSADFVYAVLSEKPPVKKDNEKVDYNAPYEKDLLYFPCWRFICKDPNNSGSVKIFLVNAISGEIYNSHANRFAV